MFGVDTTSGSVLYSRAFLSVQPFTILAYDAENPGSFNSNLYSFIDMCFHHMFSANSWFIFIQKCVKHETDIKKNLICVENMACISNVSVEVVNNIFDYIIL